MFNKNFNIKPVEFFKWACPPSIFKTVRYQFWGYQNVKIMLASQKYRAWSDYMDVQAGQWLYTGERFWFQQGKV